MRTTQHFGHHGIGVNYYLDGVNGDNYFSGTPNAAKKSLNGIFNHSDYKPGDNIFIVNTVTADGNNALDWNGQQYSHVTIYRYPGGHPLNPSSSEAFVYTGYDEYNPGNMGFAGTLINVETSMDMHGIILDGFENIRATMTESSEPNSIYVDDDLFVTPTAPLVSIAENATLTMYGQSQLQWNYSNCNGGAVNNVYLATANSVVQIGTLDPNDLLGALSSSSSIGVTKGNWGQYYYTPIAYSDGGDDYLSYLLLNENTAQAQDYQIFDDGLYYHLLSLNNTVGFEPSYNYLFWVGTWATAVHEKPTDFNPSNIDSPEDLAWVISVVNGLNGEDAEPDTDFTITDDIDMAANIWVPIGTSTNPYTGTFDANGHNITGIHSPLNSENMGMFGTITGDGTVENMTLIVDFTGGNSVNMGSVAAVMDGGTISNVEAGGTIIGATTTTTIGGIVADNSGGTVHSSFAVNTITAVDTTTHIGGFIGDNAGDLINSYANTTMSGSNHIGGLVCQNKGRVENCYSVIGDQTFPAFADENIPAAPKGINYCYTDNNANGYVKIIREGSNLRGHGTYSTTQNTHTYGYMYWDNTVSVESGQANPFKVDAIKYANNQIGRWPGLLSTLEHWVDSINGNTSLFPDITFTKWLRPTTKYINDDLPVLCFPRDNCMITIDSEGKALHYGPFDGNSHSTYISRGTYPVDGGLGNQGFGQEPQEPEDDNTSNNGVDNILEDYEHMSGYLFVYDNAINVERVPNENLFVFINEDVVFKQAADAGEFINTQVGVSFDNSCGTAKDFFGNDLTYDWHMLSTPLANAPLGISYNSNAQNWWETGDNTQVTSVSHSYMPDGSGNDHHWDFYSFYEPEYHWINLKRNSSSHHHYDAPHDFIDYTNEDIVVPGKGYMTAIDKDMYLCNDGTLNGPTNPVSVKLTKRSHEPGTEELGFNLLGNPYQAYLDVNGFLGRNNLSSYWVYIAESNNYIAGNADASSNPVLPSATLHPHQGFFVLASSDGQTVNFDYSTMALSNPEENSYFRGGKVNYPLVNLFVADDNGMKDLTVIEFNRPKTGGSMKMRAVNNANFELAAFNDGERYSILFTEKDVKRVPVTFITREDGEFTMT